MCQSSFGSWNIIIITIILYVILGIVVTIIIIDHRWFCQTSPWSPDQYTLGPALFVLSASGDDVDCYVDHRWVWSV